MKKRGYTLTELIVILAVIACITSAALPNIKSLDSYELNKKLEDATNCVIEFLNYAKAYSREKNRGCYVSVYGNRIAFSEKGAIISEYKVPSGVILNDGWVWDNTKSKIKTLYVDKGIMECNSIYVVNSNGKFDRITIKLGTWYVSREE